MGIIIALAVIILWAGHLVLVFFAVPPAWTNPQTHLHIIVQAYLYTGLFITAHDSMHGSIALNRRTNKFLGVLSLGLFAAFSYSRMFSKHMEHHRYPGTDKDPDFSVRYQDPFRWFAEFFMGYVTIRQIVTMALVFNLLRYGAGIPAGTLAAYWIIPAFLGTFQLFFFGTYFPHRFPHTEEMKPHNARTQGKNHLWAMVSCYFFGYHYEHHAYPRVPWWRLHKKKT